MYCPIDIVKIIRNDECVTQIVLNDDGKHITYDMNTPCHKHSRSILVLNDFVLKFDSPKLPCGKQAFGEYEVWKSLHKDDKKYFAELVFYDKKQKLIIQKRAIFVKRKINTKIVDIVEDLVERYNLPDVYACYNNHKIYKNNWGLTKDGPIIYDYGTVS